MIRITHHRGKCIGCNYCMEVAPGRWEADLGDGKINLLESVQKRGIYIAIVGDDEYDANKEASKICPVNIIRVEKV